MSYYNGGYHDTYEDYDTRHTAPGFNQLSGGYIKGKTAAGKADDRIITIPYAKENAVSEGADYIITCSFKLTSGRDRSGR